MRRTSDELDRRYILAHHILAPLSLIPKDGKKMMGKNITEIFEQVNRRKGPESKALSSFRTHTG